MVELEIFQVQVLEIHTKIEKEQQGVFFKLEFIQNYFQETSKSLESILLKEREVKAAITTFKKAVALSTKEDFRETQKLSVLE